MTTMLHNSTTETVTLPRTVERVIAGQPTSDGAGVTLTRVLTQSLQRRLDPFLMLDAFRTDDPKDYIGGFPDHPHRGFETVTYMIAGRMRHRDSAGHEGLLSNGGVQWMTAGRGVIHSELPEQEDGRMEGFQLWLNLPAQDKMRAPWYRDIQAAEIPEFTTREGVKVRVIAGRSQGVDGAMRREVTEPLYLDLELPAGARFAQALPPDHNAFVYVYRGGLSIEAYARARAADGDPRERHGKRRRGHARAGADPRALDRRPAAARADRAVWPVRDEHQRRDLRGRARFPGRNIRGREVVSRHRTRPPRCGGIPGHAARHRRVPFPWCARSRDSKRPRSDPRQNVATASRTSLTRVNPGRGKHLRLCPCHDDDSSSIMPGVRMPARPAQQNALPLRNCMTAAGIRPRLQQASARENRVKSVMVLYLSRNGHTARVARAVAAGVVAAGGRAERMDLVEAEREGLDWSAYDVIAVGAPVLYGNYDRRVYDFVATHKAVLDARPNSFFNVSVVARVPAKATVEGNRYMQKFLELSAWKPKDLKVVAGKVDYPRWPWHERKMIQLIMKITHGPTDPSTVIDYTDWNDVAKYGGHLLTLA